MDYETFHQHYVEAFEDAKKIYEEGEPESIDDGMDDDCLDLIMSDNYLPKIQID